MWFVATVNVRGGCEGTGVPGGGAPDVGVGGVATVNVRTQEAIEVLAVCLYREFEFTFQMWLVACIMSRGWFARWTMKRYGHEKTLRALCALC